MFCKLQGLSVVVNSNLNYFKNDDCAIDLNLKNQSLGYPQGWCYSNLNLFLMFLQIKPKIRIDRLSNTQ